MLLFCLCPADGGSEHVQAKRFVSGGGETALLRAQSAARRKHYLYPLSRSSLHRNSQYQPSPWEWVRRKHAHNTHTYTPAHTHLHPFTCTQTHTHTLLHGTWTAVFLLSMVVTPSGSHAALVCASSVCLFLFILFFLLIFPFKQHPVLTSHVALVWPGPIQTRPRPRPQARICSVVECRSVQEAAGCSLPVQSETAVCFERTATRLKQRPTQSSAGAMVSCRRGRGRQLLLHRVFLSVNEVKLWFYSALTSAFVSFL